MSSQIAGSADMPPGEGSSTPAGNVVDGDVPRTRRPHRRSRQPVERMNPGNLEFNRQVAELEARHQEEEERQKNRVTALAELEARQQEEEERQKNQLPSFLRSVCFRAGIPYWNIISGDVEDGGSPVPWKDVFQIPGPSAPLLLEAGTQQGEEELLKDSAKPADGTDFLEDTSIKIAGTQQGEEGYLKDSAKPADGTDFLEDTSIKIAGTQQGEGLLKHSAKPADDTDFLNDTSIKINSDKRKATRNKKNSKKKGTGKGRKNSHALEIKSEPSSPTKPSSTFADAASGEALVSSSSHVAVGIPLSEYNTSFSSLVTELLITPAVHSTSNSANEKELSSSSEKELSSSSKDDFKSFESGTTSYSSNSTAAASSSVDDYYTGGNNAWNNTMGDYAGSLSDARSERSLSASECITSRGYINKTSGEGSKPYDHRQSLSSAIGPGGNQEGSPCRDYDSNGGDFQKVISRKQAKTIKMMQRLESRTTAASGPIITRALVPTPPREVITIGHYIQDDCINGRKPNHKIKGKNQKGPSLSNVSKTGYTDGENVPGSSRMLLITDAGRQRALSSTSRHHVTRLEDIEEISSPGCHPMEGQLKAPVVGDTECTDSTAPPSDKTPSLGNNLANSSCVGREEQKKAMAPVGGDSDTKDTHSIAPSSDKTLSSLGHLSNSSCVKREEQKKQENEQAFSTHESSELDKIIKAANDAYKIQAASDAYMIYGVHADIETFLHSATPVIAPISCTKNDISLQDQCLWSVWRWYEEPECCGIEVDMQAGINSSSPNSSTYFVPSLSAVQLFGQSGNKFSTPEEPCLLSTNHGGLFFEYFESEMPFLRPPLFTKIKQLLNGVNLSGGNPIFGDAKQLKSVKLCDLHPASWYCVSWYPIGQIPSAPRSHQAAFLTYHSLGKLVPPTCPTYMADGLHRIICPVVGLLGYRDQVDKWYQLGEQSSSKPTPNGSWKTSPAELLNKKIRALRHCASIMSKAVVPRASGETMNYHPDYEFFWSRSQK